MPVLPAQRVLVPVDFSERCWEALSVGRDVVSPGGQLLALYVVPVDDLGDPWIPRREVITQELRARLAERGFADVPLQVCYGDPGSQIAEFASREQVGLIVIPSRGHRGIVRLLLGSVTERVIRLAHCPVLVLHDKDESYS